jgi:hypothetical protein
VLDNGSGAAHGCCGAQRLLMCANKGFRGALLDWVHIDTAPNSGAGLTVADNRVYASWVSTVARNMGLLVGFYEDSRNDVQTAASATLWDFFVSWEVQKTTLPHFVGLSGGWQTGYAWQAGTLCLRSISWEVMPAQACAAQSEWFTSILFVTHPDTDTETYADTHTRLCHWNCWHSPFNPSLQPHGMPQPPRRAPCGSLLH